MVRFTAGVELVRILQVESNKDAAIAVERLVVSGGSTCDTVATGQLAMDRLASEDYALFLSVYTLPDQTGAERVERMDAAGVGAAVIVRMRKQPVAGAFAQCLQRIAGLSDIHDDDPAEDAEATSKRDSERHRIIKSGQIVYRNAHCVMDCTVLNISASGACILPADVFEETAPFVLKIRNGLTRRCEVRWRRRGKLGVRFIQ